MYSSSRPISNRNAFWNRTAVGTYLFDAFSVLLPVGEAFVIGAVDEEACHLPPGSPLRDACRRFVSEETAHQRAHRQYNHRLAQAGHDVAALEARIEKDLQGHKTRLSADQRLCLAAAFEHITATVSAVVLRSHRLLPAASTAQAQLWRWHCTQEVAHAGVTVDLMAARNVPYLARVGWYALASVSLTMDILRHIQAFYRHDVRAGRLSPRQFWKSTLAYAVLAAPDLAAAAAGWVAYLVPRRSRTAPAISVRALQTADLPALATLEAHCWTAEQAASGADLARRIERYPALCLGAFCTRTGAALASLFMMPTTAGAMSGAKTWQDYMQLAQPHGTQSDALFGISLSSRDPAAVRALMCHFWPRAIKGRWRHIYLGSPIPGLAGWLGSNPGGHAHDYVLLRRGGAPLDPQLRYYHRKGFRRVEAVLPGYFPHASSLDYGVLLCGDIPGARWAPLWRNLPVRSLAWLASKWFKS